MLDYTATRVAMLMVGICVGFAIPVLGPQALKRLTGTEGPPPLEQASLVGRDFYEPFSLNRAGSISDRNPQDVYRDASDRFFYIVRDSHIVGYLPIDPTYAIPRPVCPAPPQPPPPTQCKSCLPQPYSCPDHRTVLEGPSASTLASPPVDTTPPSVEVLSTQDFVTTPTQAQLQNSIQSWKLKKKAGKKVTVICTLTAGGRLIECSGQGDNPPRMGLITVGQKVASQYYVVSMAGRQAGQRVQFDITWEDGVTQ